MTKENLIPKTETVCEIDNKYEVPSFEEFMKTYEADESLNYDDLESGGLGEVKGYGPCSGYWPCGDSRCYGSNACKYNERFFVLHTACPSKYCFYRGNRTKYYWVHSKSGCGNNGSSSRDKISDECRIRCPDCFNTSHMKYHKFRCSQHDTEFKSTSSTSFSIVLAAAFESDLPQDAYNKISASLRADPWEGGDDY